MSKKIELNIKTENGYEVLYPKTDSSNNIVNTEILNKFGLSEDGNVSDVLNELSKYNEYWWEEITPSYNEYTINLVDYADKGCGIEIAKYNNTSETLTYSQEATINQTTGVISLVSPQTSPALASYTITKNFCELLVSLCPVYVKSYSGDLYYLPKGTTCSDMETSALIGYNDDDGDYSINLHFYSNTSPKAKQPVSAINIIPKSSVYITSTEETTYPKDEYLNSKFYKFLGKPYNNFKYIGNIEEVGSFVLPNISTLGTSGTTVELFDLKDVDYNYLYFVNYVCDFSFTESKSSSTRIIKGELGINPGNSTFWNIYTPLDYNWNYDSSYTNIISLINSCDFLYFYSYNRSYKTGSTSSQGKKTKNLLSNLKDKINISNQPTADYSQSKLVFKITMSSTLSLYTWNYEKEHSIKIYRVKLFDF